MAVSKLTRCFLRLLSAFAWSHSNLLIIHLCYNIIVEFQSVFRLIPIGSCLGLGYVRAIALYPTQRAAPPDGAGKVVTRDADSKRLAPVTR
jgi:hypothetical protein